MDADELLEKFGKMVRDDEELLNLLEELKTRPLKEVFFADSDPNLSISRYLPYSIFNTDFLPKNYSLFPDGTRIYLKKELRHPAVSSPRGIEVQRLEKLVVRLPEISENDTLPKLFNYITQAYNAIEEIDKEK